MNITDPPPSFTAREEDEWQTAQQLIGPRGYLIALVQLLVNKHLIEVEELRESVFAEAARYLNRL